MDKYLRLIFFLALIKKSLLFFFCQTIISTFGYLIQYLVYLLLVVRFNFIILIFSSNFFMSDFEFFPGLEDRYKEINYLIESFSQIMAMS